MAPTNDIRASDDGFTKYGRQLTTHNIMLLHDALLALDLAGSVRIRVTINKLHATRTQKEA